MADEELEAGEGGKKSPILTYILIGVGVIVALAITILATICLLYTSPSPRD